MPDAPAGSAAPRAPGRRRHATVLFSDVSNSSRHAEQLEPEAYAGLLERFRALAREIIPAHGGSIARLQGDGLLALFGHDVQREDDGRRAVEAALALHAAVARLPIGPQPGAATLQLHSGVHAGLVLLIEGDIERGRFDVVGEVPNTAARLCSLAGSGDVLASAGTLGPQAHFFEVTPARRTAIRGRDAPLDVVRVLGRARLARRIDAAARRGTVPLVGRDDALGRLLDAAARVGDAGPGPTRVVHVSGEPGVGKSRLIREFADGLDRQRFTVLQGYCEHYLGAEPLQPFVTALGETLGRQALAQPPARVQAAIVGHLGRLAAGRTLVLVLDDWQWADDASRRALDAVLDAGGPRLVVLASRSGGLDDDPVARRAEPLPLAPLDAAASTRAVLAWLPDADPFLVQQVCEQAGGSPLFIEELCLAVAAGGDSAAQRGVKGPAWLDALVAARLERLDPPMARLLQLASVVGNIVPEPLLRPLAAAERLPLEGWAAQDLLVPAGPPGVWRFRHALTRDAVYATVDAEQRRSWHLRVAQTLAAAADAPDGAESLEALAYHYDAAQHSEQAAQYADLAGDKALAAAALDRARAQYLTALRALDARAVLSPAMQLRWCAIAAKLGQACVFDPLDMAECAPMFERALHLARATGDLNARARAEYWLAYVAYGRGRPREAARHAEQALANATASGDERLVAQLEATLGQALASAGRYARALPLLEHAVRRKQALSRPGSGAAIGSAYSLARIGFTLGDLGRFAEAHERLGEALALLGGAEHSVRASILELQCAVLLWQGRWDEARAAGLAGAEVALRCRSRYLTAMGRALAGCAAWAIEGSEQALAALRDATHWIDARGGAVSTSLNHGWLVEGAVTLGQRRQAAAFARQLFQRARLHDRHGLAMGCCALARQAAAARDRRRAEHYLRAAAAAADARDSARERAVNALAAAQVALALDVPARAQPLLDEAAQAFARMGMAWHLQRVRAVALAL